VSDNLLNAGDVHKCGDIPFLCCNITVAVLGIGLMRSFLKFPS
jgi:hypothetical protein